MPALTSTMKIGLGVSLALHLVVVVGVNTFRARPQLRSDGLERSVAITFIAEEKILKAALDSEPVHEPTLRPSPVVELIAPATAPPKTEPPVIPVVEARPEPRAATTISTGPEPAVPTPALPSPVTTSVQVATRKAEAAPTAQPAQAAQPGTRAAPLYRKNPEPDYPASARRRRQEGLVILSVTVSAEGRAARVAIKQSSGVTTLDEAAVAAVRSWEFQPARVGLLAVQSEIEVPVRFKLAD